MPEPSAEDRLLARLRDRDPQVRRVAEGELIEQHHGSVEALLRRMVGSDREDCVQEVFVDVIRGLPTFSGRSRLSTWIYRIAVRRAWKCLAERRRHAVGRDHDPELVERAVDPNAVVAEQVDAAVLARRFQLALEHLDVDQRTVLALTVVDGFGPPEIGEVLGIPVGTVHSRLHRARARLRELLGIEDPAT